LPALLNAQARSELFSQFATLERAGIPLLQALPIIGQQVPKDLQPRVQKLTRFIQQGSELAQAGRRSGLFLPWEARLIAVAGEAGKLQTTFTRLGNHYAARARRLMRFKGRLVYPIAILVLAVFIAPVPALILGSIGPTLYILRTVVPLLGLYCSIKLLVWRYRVLSLTEQPYAFAAIVLAIPLIGGLVRRQQRRDFLASLATLLEAGIPAIEALTLAAESVTNPVLREEFAGVSDAVRQGATVAHALSQSTALDDSAAAALINTGEVSGKLDDMLWYHVCQLDERLDLQLDLLAEWTPRFMYALVVAFVVSTIL